MRPGDRRVYRVTSPDGLKERAVSRVTKETRLIANGVTARVVSTTVSEEGMVVEDNRAWYAQDAAGNVWYLGELARELEAGRVTSTKGSWEAGVDGARPGVIMPARPRPGLAYKFYATGVGPVLGIEVSGGGDREELVGFRRGGLERYRGPRRRRRPGAGAARSLQPGDAALLPGR